MENHIGVCLDHEHDWCAIPLHEDAQICARCGEIMQPQIVVDPAACGAEVDAMCVGDLGQRHTIFKKRPNGSPICLTHLARVDIGAETDLEMEFPTKNGLPSAASNIRSIGFASRERACPCIYPAGYRLNGFRRSPDLVWHPMILRFPWIRRLE
jgi:hypothetical protein